MKFDDRNGNGIRDIGGEFRVNTTTTGKQQYHDVATDGQGTFVVVWESETDHGWDVIGQRFGAGGQPLGTEFVINTTLDGDQHEPNIDMLADGRFVVAWDRLQGNDSDYFARQFDAEGQPLGDEFQANTFAALRQANGHVTMLPDGGFFLTWSSEQEGGWYDAFARQYDASGIALGAEFRLNQHTSGHQGDPSIVLLPENRYLAAWSGTEDGNGRSVTARLFSLESGPLGDEFVVNQIVAGDQFLSLNEVNRQVREHCTGLGGPRRQFQRSLCSTSRPKWRNARRSIPCQSDDGWDARFSFS